MFHSLLDRYRKRQNEEAFTLVELMIVVVIIGILAVIAIIIFTTQQKNAIAATVKSDVKNTATEVASSLRTDPFTENVASLVPNTIQSDKDTTVTVSGGWDGYTVTGMSNTSDFCWIFVSYTGHSGECSELDGDGGIDELPNLVYADFQFMKFVMAQPSFFPEWSASNPRISYPGTNASIVEHGEGAYTMTYSHNKLSGSLVWDCDTQGNCTSQATGDFTGLDNIQGGGGMG